MVFYFNFLICSTIWSKMVKTMTKTVCAWWWLNPCEPIGRSMLKQHIVNLKTIFQKITTFVHASCVVQIRPRFCCIDKHLTTVNMGALFKSFTSNQLAPSCQNAHRVCATTYLHKLACLISKFYLIVFCSPKNTTL